MTDDLPDDAWLDRVEPITREAIEMADAEMRLQIAFEVPRLLSLRIRLMRMLRDACERQCLPCMHEGIGLPGCVVCERCAA
jgi:hypothetical protein